jgi:hypothetical protein
VLALQTSWNAVSGVVVATAMAVRDNPSRAGSAGDVFGLDSSQDEVAFSWGC